MHARTQPLGRCFLVAALHGALACTPRPAVPSAPVTCELAARGASDAAYAALYAQHGVPLVLQGDAVWACPCGERTPAGASQDRMLAGGDESRTIGGDTQPRSLGGDTQPRSLGGDTQPRSLGGDTQPRSLGGDTQARSLGGDTQARTLGGDTQDRSLGGDTQAHVFGGGTQDRDVGGAVQPRAVGGDMQVPTCSTAPSCRGFVVSGFRTVRFYDGVAVGLSSDGCVYASR